MIGLVDLAYAVKVHIIAKSEEQYPLASLVGFHIFKPMYVSSNLYYKCF